MNTIGSQGTRLFGTHCCGRGGRRPVRNCPVCDRSIICDFCPRCSSCATIIYFAMEPWLDQQWSDWTAHEKDRKKQMLLDEKATYEKYKSQNEGA